MVVVRKRGNEGVRKWRNKFNWKDQAEEAERKEKEKMQERKKLERGQRLLAIAGDERRTSANTDNSVNTMMNTKHHQTQPATNPASDEPSQRRTQPATNTNQRRKNERAPELQNQKQHGVCRLPFLEILFVCKDSNLFLLCQQGILISSIQSTIID
jgi:hypothetical protein